MDRSSKPKAPNLSLIVPSTSSLPYHKPLPALVQSPEQIPHPPLQTPSRSHIVAPAKQKRLFPVSCRLVPTDQWFTTRIDRTWKVLDLKIWLLSKAFPTPVLPLPASYRPSSPVTFAVAPPPPPLRAPPPSTSYQVPSFSSGHASPNKLLTSRYSPSTISPITFAAPPSLPPLPSIPSPPQSPQKFPVPSSPFLLPNQHPSSPPLSPPTETTTNSKSSGSLVSERQPSLPSSLDEDTDDVAPHANPYGTVPDDNIYDDEDEDEVVHVTSASYSIPYSYNTGTPAISGLAALESNRNLSGRNYGGGSASIEVDLLKKATAMAKRWHVYSFSTGMLLSDDLPLSEYNIRPHELLELHRASAYVSLPRVILPALEAHSPSHSRHALRDPHPPSSRTSRAYHPTGSGRASPSHTQADTWNAGSSASSDDDEGDDAPVGNPYAQPYFDGWVWVLRDNPTASNGTLDMGLIDTGDMDVPHGRRMRRRSRAKSEASTKAGRGKDRARMEREWKDMPQPLGKEGEAETQLPENDELWKKRWMIVREGFLTVWREREDSLPEARYEIAACAGLYGGDRLQSATAGAMPNIAPFADPVFNLTSSQAFNMSNSSSGCSSLHSPHVICARFRQGSSHSSKYPGRKGGKTARKFPQRTGVWLVLKLADETTHEHLLRIFHRLAYSTPVSSSRRPPSSSSSSFAQPRTLRTDFLPNPIPHPLSLSFSAPSPIEHGDGSPVWALHDPASSDASEYEDEWIDADFAAGGRSRHRANGKGIARYVGLGNGISVHYPEWRESIIRKATHAGLGVNVPEYLERKALSPQDETPRGDQVDVYGFARDDAGDYAATLVREYEDSDDPDSDAYSESEWEAWAYDLDRPKAVEEVGTRYKPSRKFAPSGLHTPHGSPVSDDPQAVVISDPPAVASSSSTNVWRPRSRSVDAEKNPIQRVVSPPQSPTAATSPTTPGARGRASTISAHPRNNPVVVGGLAAHNNRSTLHFTAAAASSQMDPLPRSNETTTTSRVAEPNTTTGGVRGLMRGLNMRAGKESFLRGLENALDFVEGK